MSIEAVIEPSDTAETLRPDTVASGLHDFDYLPAHMIGVHHVLLVRPTEVQRLKVLRYNDMFLSTAARDRRNVTKRSKIT